MQNCPSFIIHFVKGMIVECKCAMCIYRLGMRITNTTDDAVIVLVYFTPSIVMDAAGVVGQLCSRVMVMAFYLIGVITCCGVTLVDDYPLVYPLQAMAINSVNIKIFTDN